MSAWKCWPSPITSKCSQASPPAMPSFTLSAVTISMPQVVPRLEERQTGERYGNQARRDHRQAHGRGNVRQAKEAVAEAVDHVEERVGVRQPEPEFGQGVDRVEHPGEKG